MTGLTDPSAPLPGPTGPDRNRCTQVCHLFRTEDTSRVYSETNADDPHLVRVVAVRTSSVSRTTGPYVTPTFLVHRRLFLYYLTRITLIFF